MMETPKSKKEVTDDQNLHLKQLRSPFERRDWLEAETDRFKVRREKSEKVKPFLEKILLGEYKSNSSHQPKKFGTYINECKEEFKIVKNILGNLGSSKVYQGKKINLLNIDPGNSLLSLSYISFSYSLSITYQIDKKTLLIDLDETLIHSEDIKEGTEYDFKFELPPFRKGDSPDVSHPL